MNIGYTGLGALGDELARRFLPTHALSVWDLNPAASARLGALGARVSPSAINSVLMPL
jgi:3-hydroxyisobutyrate dehydrogenase